MAYFSLLRAEGQKAYCPGQEIPVRILVRQVNVDVREHSIFRKPFPQVNLDNPLSHGLRRETRGTGGIPFRHPEGAHVNDEGMNHGTYRDPDPDPGDPVVAGPAGVVAVDVPPTEQISPSSAVIVPNRGAHDIKKGRSGNSCPEAPKSQSIGSFSYLMNGEGTGYIVLPKTVLQTTAPAR